MNYLLSTLFFIFGGILGSFINVIAVRYNTGIGIDGRSRCFSCGKTLHFLELIPFFSFIFLRGKCSKCKSKISLQDFIMEVGMAFLTLFLFLKFSLSLQTFYFIFIFSLLLIILAYDLKHKIIPDGVVFLFIFFSFLYIFVDLKEIIFHTPNLVSFLSGFIIALPFFFLWLVSNGKWMGLGDGKLSLGIGFLLGISKGFSALALAFWIGAVISLLVICISKILNSNKLSLEGKKLTMKSEVPFAPFIILGFLIVFFTGLNLF
ncbi:MAG: prepilin peptidase [Candidatus Paceibacterota bacterium]